MFFRILYIILGQKKKTYGTEDTQYDSGWAFHTDMMIFKIKKY